ncbi:MAG TPA: aminopeptidase [Sphingomicrobium sp.]|nr:aminopeptidase [Sphingomicrobium sp.]
MNRMMIVAAMAAGLAACDRQAPAPAGDEGAETADSTDVDFDAIARRVVTESAGVKPGEVVVINGSIAEPRLLEALQAAVLLAGGHPIVAISFPRANKRALTQAPMEYLRQPPRADLAMLEAGDVFISAGAVEDPELFSDVDEARLNAVREANQAAGEAAARKRARSVDIGQAGGIPTPAYAKSRNADYKAMRAMFFRALAVPSNVIAQRGAVVSGKMQPGQQVRLRSSSGTDLTFKLAAGRSRVSTGRAADNDTGQGMASAFLPAGDFYACVDPASANGVLVSPADRFRGKPVRNLRVTFQNGAITSITADEEADALQRYFAELDEGGKRMSLINIGLNPESRPLKGSDYMSWEMSGVPTVVVGNAMWAGCAHGGEASQQFHQLGATLAAGSAEVIKDGNLVVN